MGRLRGVASGPPVTDDSAPADEALWCRVTKPVPAGRLLGVLLTAAEPRGTPSHPVKEEPAEPECPAPSHTDIQLLPQQAGMASILATAVINSEYATVPPHPAPRHCGDNPQDLKTRKDWLLL